MILAERLSHMNQSMAQLVKEFSGENDREILILNFDRL